VKSNDRAGGVLAKNCDNSDTYEVPSGPKEVTVLHMMSYDESRVLPIMRVYIVMHSWRILGCRAQAGFWRSDTDGCYDL
jgi:hypothetical protein